MGLVIVLYQVLRHSTNLADVKSYIDRKKKKKEAIVLDGWSVTSKIF